MPSKNIDECAPVERLHHENSVAAWHWHRIRIDFALAPRECEILKGILADRKEAAIAFELGITQKTVHTYVERVYKKLDVHSRVQVVLRLLPYLAPER